MPQSNLPIFPQHKSCQLSFRWSPLDPFIALPIKSASVKSLCFCQVPAFHLPSELHSILKHRSLHKPTTFLVEEVSPVWIASCYTSSVSFCPFWFTVIVQTYWKGRTSALKRVQNSKGKYRGKRNGAYRR